jgi:MFS family permease
MMFSRRLLFHGDPHLQTAASFSLILFFIFLADAILSFWVPNLLQSSLNDNSFLMGIVFSFSSLVGFLADLLFPQILKSLSVRKLIALSIFVSLAFILSLFIGSKYPFIAIFLLAMAIWGIYYELLAFASHQFIADTMPATDRTSGWAILGIFKNLAYLLGPIFAAWFLFRGEIYVILFSTIFVLIGSMTFFLTRKKHERPISFEMSEVSLWKELSHWKVLIKRVWPVITISLVIGFIDSVFWTTGAVWTESISRDSFWGGLILPAYQLPSIFIGLFIARLKIFKGKKRLALKFLMASGFMLSLIYFEVPIFSYIVLILSSSIMLSFVYPLVDATYADIIARMGVTRKHLVGLSSSAISLAYIVGPLLAGYIASIFGERKTFALVGVVTVLTAFVLSFITPRKLLLPRTEMEKWKS